MKFAHLIPAALLLALAACSKVTVENYDKLRAGQSYDEVQQLLGKPSECDDLLSARSCVWRSGKASVNVSFVGGQVILFTAQGLR
ncbi:MAG: hypothetical protein H2060_09710 [Azoarcus sp.]|nr:hypothetical protein [Azoarcus sp.]